MGDLVGVLSHEYTPEGCTQTHKSSFCPYKQVSGKNGDHELPMLSNYVIDYEKFKKSCSEQSEDLINTDIHIICNM